MDPPGPSCPRCGYDLTGQVAAWTESCPLTGRCPECGLDLDWRDSLNPAYHRATRLFEHADQHKLRALLRTIRLCYQPRRLFSLLHLEHAIVWPRLVILAITSLVAGQLALSLTRLIPVLVLNSMYNSWSYLYDDLGSVIWSLLWPLREPDYSFRSEPTVGWALVGALAYLAVPFLLLASPLVMPGSKVRSDHMRRLALYAAATLPIVSVCWNITYDVWTFALTLDDYLGRTFHRSISGLQPARDWMFFHRLALFLVLFGGWSFFFWHAALSRYLRIEKPFRTTAAVLILSAVATLALFFFVPPGIRFLFAHV